MNKHHRVWSLQEAKAKFSEVVRLAQTEGPQDVTVHGKHVVTVATPAPSHIGDSNLTVHDLIRAFQSCPHPEFFDDLDKFRIREPLVLKDVEFE